jgi:hypothetical protein
VEAVFASCQGPIDLRVGVGIIARDEHGRTAEAQVVVR